MAVRKIDLLICDINMPQLDGIELYTKIRATKGYEKAPIILWSGIDVTKGISLAAKDSTLRFLRKPFSLKTLQDTINELVNARFTGDYNPGIGGIDIK